MPGRAGRTQPCRRRALGDYLRDFDSAEQEICYRYTLYGHFGDGCVHIADDFGLKTPEWASLSAAPFSGSRRSLPRHGGSLSGEHGDGQAKAELLAKMFGTELLQAFREFKSIWDPDGR